MRIWKPKFERRQCFGPSHMQGVADRRHYRKQPLWARLVSGLHLPRYLQMQNLGFPCCCEEEEEIVIGDPCTYCNAGTTPAQLEVTFSGITDGVLSLCSGCNTSLTLDQAAPAYPCLWTCCADTEVYDSITYYTSIAAAIYLNGLRVTIFIHRETPYFSYDVVWEDTVTTAMDCTEIDNTLTYNAMTSSTYACDGSSATCTLTAI